jgi:hypothetical protein
MSQLLDPPVLPLGECRIYRAVQIRDNEFPYLQIGQMLAWDSETDAAVTIPLSIEALAGVYIGEELLGCKAASREGWRGVFIQVKGSL